MNIKPQQNGRYLWIALSTILLTLVTGCEPPSDEEMEAYWEADSEMETFESAEEEISEGVTGFLDGVKADSGLSEDNPRKKSAKKWSVHHSDQRPLIGNEAIGHGTPQPWKPAEPNNESSEDDS